MICNIVKDLQAAGADFFTLREPGVAADLLSPRTFKEMIAPTMTKILSAWEGNKKCFHICGSTDPICEMMWQCCVDSGTPMISFDIKNTLLESRKKLGDEALIVGNYDVFGLPCREETTPDEARQGIRDNIDGLVDAVWPGCDLWPDIKPENWFAIEEEARTYKAGPTPAVGRL
jgi:[methyl-Co(III) methanol-specific corrinoid protein]:coenzyme M methyltransferase